MPVKKRTKQPDSVPSDNSQGAMLVDNPNRWKSWWTRFNLSVFMILGFAGIIWVGHFALVGFILLLQIAGFQEVLKIRETSFFSPKGNAKVPYETNLLDWSLFSAMQYFFYGHVIFNQFRANFITAGPVLQFLSRYHYFISISFVFAIIVGFVLSLKKTKYKEQFQYVTWTIMMLVALFPSNFHVYNIFQGVAWFLFPVSLIICNDITAYIWGFFFGRTSLIELSPKKTWEGFIGAFVSTIIFAIIFVSLLKGSLFWCPKLDLFEYPDCVKPEILSLRSYEIPALISEPLSLLGLNWAFVKLTPMQVYAFFFACFASLIAPFGGFLASGFKRAFGIKDFGNLIPGHGGIVDRMDCQVLMAAFSYTFYQSFVLSSTPTTSMMQAISSLPLNQQIDLLSRLQEHLTPYL